MDEFYLFLVKLVFSDCYKNNMKFISAKLLKLKSLPFENTANDLCIVSISNTILPKLITVQFTKFLVKNLIKFYLIQV